jgi:predicted RNA binding protein YcfA (HicA-like mRNA interferase family)
MKLPRDISGGQLVRVLQDLGYSVVRQKGSHVRLTHPGPPQAHVVVPMHRQIKVGTLHDILQTISEQRSLSLQELLELL